MKSLSRAQLFATPWTVGYQAPLSTGFSRQEYWSGLPFLSPGIFLTQGLSPGLPHCGQTLYPLSHQGRSEFFLSLLNLACFQSEIICMPERYFGMASSSPLQVPPLLSSQIPMAWAGALGPTSGSYHTWGLASCFSQLLSFFWNSYSLPACSYWASINAASSRKPSLMG